MLKILSRFRKWQGDMWYWWWSEINAVKWIVPWGALSFAGVINYLFALGYLIGAGFNTVTAILFIWPFIAVLALISLMAFTAKGRKYKYAEWAERDKEKEKIKEVL